MYIDNAYICSLDIIASEGMIYSDCGILSQAVLLVLLNPKQFMIINL